MSGTHDIPDTSLTRSSADTDILRVLEDYWHALRLARHLPARSDLAPYQIDVALPHAFILHRVAPGVARIRMAGQHIHDLLRMDARGMPFSILFTPASRTAMSDLVEKAFAMPAIVAADLVSPAQMFCADLTARMVMLPLSDHQGVVSRILGGIVAAGQTGQRPRRFDLLPQGHLRIDPLDVAQKPDAMRPALRLVVNNS